MKITYYCVLLFACEIFSMLAIADPFNFGSKKPNAEAGVVIDRAIEDYYAVLSGKWPIHAKLIQEAFALADGGTKKFKADGYQITVVKSLTNVGGIHGYMYGPIIRFEKPFVNGNSDRISHVSFYSHDELRKLLKAAGR